MAVATVTSSAAGFGLPALIPPELGALASLKFANRPFKLSKRSRIFLPKICSLTEFTNLQDVDVYLSKQNIDVDSHLNNKERLEIFVYKNYIENSLFPCVQYAWWIDERNYSESTRPLFAKSAMFPLNFYYLEQFQRKASELMNTLYGDFRESSEIHSKVYSSADKCFETLSIRLGDNDYFFGQKPSSLDAAVFAYIAPIFKVPLKNPVIKNHLNKYDNLVKYVRRISEKYFYDSEKDFNDSIKLKQCKEKTDMNTLQNTVFGALFAIIAMLGYAYSNGLLVKSWKDDLRDYDMFESDEDDN